MTDADAEAWADLRSRLLFKARRFDEPSPEPGTAGRVGPSLDRQTAADLLDARTLICRAARGPAMLRDDLSIIIDAIDATLTAAGVSV